MDNSKLAKAVACLLPDDAVLIRNDLDTETKGIVFRGSICTNEQILSSSFLAFECHKALSHKFGQCLITRYSDIEEGVGVLYDYIEAGVGGTDYTDEQAIFAAVQHAYDKREGV